MNDALIQDILVQDSLIQGSLPQGFTQLTHEPEFNPAVHLQLEAPSDIFSLQDFGYDRATGLADSPVDFAATSVFRILSAEGAAALHQTAKALEPFATSNPRIERNVRGGVYRSKFLRDLCLCEDITQFLSEIAGLPLMPHTIPHQLGHMNFNPAKIGANVDKWHVDTLRFDYVMFVTDPTQYEGGQFQYFKGTKQEMAALKASGAEVPPEKIISPAMPGPGYAILQQGNLVVHQAKGLTKPGERISMVNGYVAADPAISDYSRYDQLCHADPEDVVTTEFSRHSALHATRLLEKAVLADGFHTDHGAKADKLEKAANILLDAAAQIRRGKQDMEHFGD